MEDGKDEDNEEVDRSVSPPASPPLSDSGSSVTGGSGTSHQQLPRLPTEEEQREQFMTVTDTNSEGTEGNTR